MQDNRSSLNWPGMRKSKKVSQRAKKVSTRKIMKAVRRMKVKRKRKQRSDRYPSWGPSPSPVLSWQKQRPRTGPHILGRVPSFWSTSAYYCTVLFPSSFLYTNLNSSVLREAHDSDTSEDEKDGSDEEDSDEESQSSSSEDASDGSEEKDKTERRSGPVLLRAITIPGLKLTSAETKDKTAYVGKGTTIVRHVLFFKKRLNCP